MKTALRIAIVGFFCAAFLLTLDYFGNERVFGYELQVDMRSARVMRVKYVLFVPSRTIQTNVVSSIAETIKRTSGERWIPAVRRPLLRRRPEELPGAKVLASIKTLSAFLQTAELADNRRAQLVSQLLIRMEAGSPADIDKWVDDQVKQSKQG